MLFWKNTARRLARSAYALPICLAFAGLASLAVLHVTPEPGDTAFTIIFPPGTPFEEVAVRLQKAGAQLLGPGAQDNIVVARLINSHHKDALRAEGALLFLSANTTSLCVDTTTGTENRAL